MASDLFSKSVLSDITSKAIELNKDVPFFFASTGDFHIGVRRNEAWAMRAMFEKHVLNHEVMSKIKLLTIPGDFFDRSLYLAEEPSTEADRLIAKIFKVCEKYGVVLRVLEGTPSHDARQNNRFAVLYELLSPKVDFKLFETVDIEYIPSLDVNVLYIPDEAHPTTHKTKEVVEALLEAKGLTQVDLCFMHGFFEYQIPHGAKDGAFHDFEFYNRIVKYWISIGHVHVRSRLGKVLAQGSLDRISHGEEGPKGFVMASVRQEGGDVAWFIDNPDAHTYKTIDCTGMEVDRILTLVDEVCGNIRPQSRVRIEADKNNPIFTMMPELNKSWPFIHFSKLPRSTEDDDAVEKLLDENLKSYSSLKIDKETLSPLLEERLIARSIDSDKIARALSRLAECL